MSPASLSQQHQSMFLSTMMLLSLSLGCSHQIESRTESPSPSKKFSYSVDKTKTGRVVNFTNVKTNRTFSQLFLNECLLEWDAYDRLWVLEQRSPVNGGDRVALFYEDDHGIHFTTTVSQSMWMDAPAAMQYLQPSSSNDESQTR